jgi:hypothetical protein
MKALRPENIFDATKFCDFFSKVLFNNFVTIFEDKRGRFYASTTVFDVLRLIIGLSYFIWLYFDVTKIELEENSRSMVVELTIWANTRFQVIHPIAVILLGFFQREIYFSIKSNIKWVDDKVRA